MTPKPTPEMSNKITRLCSIFNKPLTKENQESQKKGKKSRKKSAEKSTDDASGSTECANNDTDSAVKMETDVGEKKT